MQVKTQKKRAVSHHASNSASKRGRGLSLSVKYLCLYPESQCGFRSQRSTVDMIFSVRQLQEKCREQQQPLFIVFIDLTKAFDLVSRDGLFKILPLIGCPPKLLSFLESFHNNMHGTVRFDGNMSEAFNIRSGVKQGCVLAPTLFGIFFSVLLKHAFRTTNAGIFLRSRTDGKLFNIAHYFSILQIENQSQPSSPQRLFVCRRCSSGCSK